MSKNELRSSGKDQSFMPQKRILYFDVLNILACICVIWLHCNSVLYSYDPGAGLWRLSLFVQVICHFAVPAFFMISGANLMNYREKYSTAEFIKRRFLRTLIPLLIWSGILLVKQCSQGLVELEDFQHVVFLFLTSSIETVYWFFFPLFAIYLCIPVLSLIAQGGRKNDKYFLYLAGMGIFFTSIFPFFADQINLGYSEHIIFPMAMGFLPYALLGYYLANNQPSRPVCACIYAVGIACAFYMYRGTISMSAIKGGLDKDLIDYQSFASYGFAITVFLFFRNRQFRLLDNDRARKILSVVSGASFGVYLIHMLTMELFGLATGVETYSYGWQLFGEIPVYFIALAVVLLVKKIPYLGKILFP